MTVVGVDGCKAGWVAALVEPSTPAISFAVFSTFAALLRALGDAAAIAIDIPIGLHDGTRECDVLARKFIGPRSASVFPAPCHSVLACPDYASARTVSIATTGKSLSAQAFAITPKIREVDTAMSPGLQERVREAHPEACFTAIHGTPMQFSKRTPAGFEERRATLEAALPGLALPALTEASRLFRGTAADDILDAAALAWSARRLADGTCVSLPATPSVDARGLRMEVIY